MDYFGYIFSSYAATVLILGALIGWIMIDQRGRKRDLAELESQGIRRRSQARTAEAAHE